MINIINSLRGMLRIELVSADIGDALERIACCGIILKEIEYNNDLSVSFLIQSCDYIKLKNICEKKGDSLAVKKRQGLHWILLKARKRVVILLGMLLLLLFVIYLPTHIFFVQVEGNHILPEKKIIASAEACGIRFGASRRDVRSEKVKNALLAAEPDLKWTGVNTKGCTAIISVKEREREKSDKQSQPSVSSIVALENGIVSSVTVLSGSPLCKIGQAVSKGQVLISGYTDNGLSLRASRAEGEVFADTIRTVRAIQPITCNINAAETNSFKRYSILLGKKRINLWQNSRIWNAVCGRMYKEYCLKLPGNFRLPISVAVEEITERKVDSAKVNLADAEESLRSFSEDYLNQHMIAGSILKQTISVSEVNGLYLLSGEYNCREMIGCTHADMIGDYNGENR